MASDIPLRTFSTTFEGQPPSFLLAHSPPPLSFSPPLNRHRFAVNKTATEAAAHMKSRIQHSYLNRRTNLYDALQAFQNEIAY